MLKHRPWVIVVAILLGLSGLWAFLRTPIDALPDLSDNQVLVYADWPAHRPLEIEQQITRPLSNLLQGIPGLRTVRGSSDVGFSLIHCIFEDRVGLEQARQRVIEKLANARVQLPEGVMAKVAPDGIPTGQIFWYAVEGSQDSLANLRDYQDRLIAPKLRMIPGVAEVASVGGFVSEVHIELETEKIIQSGLTLQEIEPSLKASLHSLGKEASIEAIQAIHVASLSSDVRLDQIARVYEAAAPRSGVFEMDGSERVAGVVHLRYGYNPLEVTRAVRRELVSIGDSLPRGVRLIPCYDRTPLIRGAIGTVSRTLLEAFLVTTICVFVLLRHWRTSLVISLTLPLAIVIAFLILATLRYLRWLDVQTNIMSLTGIIVSVGVLLDSSIVISENITHRLRLCFGERPVKGDVRGLIAEACSRVAVPACISVLLMVVSFLPVFALEGIDGRMYRPLVWTKTLSMLAVAVMTVTIVPVLGSYLIRGRLREESDSRIVQSFARVYQPTLGYLLRHPTPILIFHGLLLILASCATGNAIAVRSVTAIAVGMIVLLGCRWRWKVLWISACLGLALFGQAMIAPIGLALRLPLDEGMVMDMPITIPRIAIAQAADDLKARNMILCRFPEVQMVTGKAGRAETPFDPAPIDMIETMVEFRPTQFWPRRRLLRTDAMKQCRKVLQATIGEGWIEPPTDVDRLATEIVDTGMLQFNAIQREVCWQRLEQFQESLAHDLANQLTQELVLKLQQGNALNRNLSQAEIHSLSASLPRDDIRRIGHQIDSNLVHAMIRELLKSSQERGLLKNHLEWSEDDAFSSTEASLEQFISASTWLTNVGRRWLNLESLGLSQELAESLKRVAAKRWAQELRELNAELRSRASATWTQIVCTELFARVPIIDEALATTWNQVLDARYGLHRSEVHHGPGHSTLPPVSNLPIIDPHAGFDRAIGRLTKSFEREVGCWPHDSESLTGNGGELDLSVQMPGWANVWTKPIQNRVDMLATGVLSEVGIRVLGEDFDTVVEASERLAEMLRDLPGAANVVADPIRDKAYVDLVVDESAARELDVVNEDVQQIVREIPTGRVIHQVQNLGHSTDVRLKIAGRNIEAGTPLASLVVRSGDSSHDTPSESKVSMDRFAQAVAVSGPASIKSENGLLRNYVRLNVVGMSADEFVTHAKKFLQDSKSLPREVKLEWTGQFEHAAQTRSAVLGMAPWVLLLGCLLLYIAFRDWTDAGLMLLSVPGALAGGILCQWLLGFPFSLAVGVGYVACFGMATSTSMIMLVYLREAVEQAGDLKMMTETQLRESVIQGAVQRLRPKLLTEIITVFSLAPMLWSTGVGADVVRPMAAPVLGGILIADEVVDLLIPIAFFAVRNYRRKRAQA